MLQWHPSLTVCVRRIERRALVGKGADHCGGERGEHVLSLENHCAEGGYRASVPGITT
ncbi:hypothetical protein KCP69_12510 [Salmonella enterica subsp. enterica]|nr:hypothetical protein KCP69_12510 [Salmonella enterica subsp. enterica]